MLSGFHYTLLAHPQESLQSSHTEELSSPHLSLPKVILWLYQARLESLRWRVTTQDQPSTQGGPELVDTCPGCYTLQGTIFSCVFHSNPEGPSRMGPYRGVLFLTSFIGFLPFPLSLSGLPLCAFWDPLPNNLLGPKFFSDVCVWAISTKTEMQCSGHIWALPMKGNPLWRKK